MKGLSIFIESSNTIRELDTLRMLCNNIDENDQEDTELMLILDIYKKEGFQAAKAALSTSPCNSEQLSTLTGKEVLLINGWDTILTCLPVQGSDEYIAVFASNPTQAVMLDRTGYNADKRIYMVREPLKLSKSKQPKKAKSTLMTEPDFPIEQDT